MDKPWKRTERKVAAMLGGERAGPTGRNGPDVLHSAFAPEVKHRETIPAWLDNAMAQAIRNAPVDKLPLVVLHQAGKRMSGALVVMSFDDFVEWFGDVLPPV
jgi:hypothetical protein